MNATFLLAVPSQGFLSTAQHPMTRARAWYTSSTLTLALKVNASLDNMILHQRPTLKTLRDR